MKKLIPIINKLQEVFSTVNTEMKIDLPQIAVVGEQSVGKSVLETIVGHDVLPRGSGIVTRRPLILQLQNSSTPMKATLTDKVLDRKGISYKKNFNNWDDLRPEIAGCTEKAAGKSGILSEPLFLAVSAPDVIDLTLVDLPGLTKVTTEGQDKDTPEQIRKMVLEVVSRPNCIILAIAAGNVDLANSEALKISRQLDPKGERTVGVVTKLDLLDKGTDCADIFRGKLFRLKKGFVGLKLRSQEDIQLNKSFEKSSDEEDEFFEKHPAYQEFKERMGVKFLRKNLSETLLSHIKSVIPDLKQKVDGYLTQAQDRMQKLGPMIIETDLKAVLLQMINEFSAKYIGSIEGKNLDDTKELFGGARINQVFFKKFLPFLESLDPQKQLTDSDIRLRIDISKGTSCGLNIPDTAFESLVKMQVEKLETPSLRCCDQVLNELIVIVDHCLKNFVRFPILKDKIREFSVSLLESYIKPLKQHITNMIKCELAFINTNHPDFFSSNKVVTMMDSINPTSNLVNQPKEQPILSGTAKKVDSKEKDLYTLKNEPIQIQSPPTQPSNSLLSSKMDREKMEVQVIRTLLVNYFDIIRKQISDAVPKAIMFFLVNSSTSNIAAELIKTLYTQSKPEDILKENEDVKQKRITTHKLLQVLIQAQETLNTLKDSEIEN